MDEERVKNLIKNLIIEIGEDPTREGLRDTPKRIAKMYKEIFGGYESDSQIGVQFSEDSDTVIVKNIEFYSMCEHHMLPFFGKYISKHALKIGDSFSSLRQSLRNVLNRMDRVSVCLCK